LHSGHTARREAELRRLAKERAEFEAELVRHPEWAHDAPDWPQLDPDADL
jgi:hypothetical protein